MLDCFTKIPLQKYSAFRQGTTNGAKGKIPPTCPPPLFGSSGTSIISKQVKPKNPYTVHTQQNNFGTKQLHKATLKDWNYALAINQSFTRKQTTNGPYLEIFNIKNVGNNRALIFKHDNPHNSKIRTKWGRREKKRLHTKKGRRKENKEEARQRSKM